MKMADIGNGIPHSKPNGSLPPLQTYVNEISAAADTITAYCAENALPHPAFDPEAPAVTIPPTAPLDVQAARQKIIASAARIQQVVTEPAEYLPNLAIHVRFDLLWFCVDVRSIFRSQYPNERTYNAFLQTVLYCPWFIFLSNTMSDCCML